MSKICHLCDTFSTFYMDAQVATVRGLLKTSRLSPDAPAYIMCARWFALWKDSVGFAGPPTGTRVPPIDNGAIMEGGDLKRGLSEGSDYDIVTSEVWGALHGWYGGGPEITRRVEVNPRNGRMVVMVWPTRFEVHYRRQKREIEFSLFGSVGKLKELAAAQFGVDPMRSRLCDYFRLVRQMPLADELLLCDYHINETVPLLLETMDANGVWCLPAVSSANDNKVERTPGLCGLMNIGNTCYMNSGLQCLVHIQQLVSFFEGDWESQINLVNPLGTKGSVARAFAQLLKQIWDPKRQEASIAPRLLKAAVGDVADQFSGTTQQDSHEFLEKLLDMIHEDLNRVTDKPIVSEVVGDGTNDEECANKFWTGHKSRNDSIIVDLFHGLYKSRLVCPNCHQTTVVFDPYSSVAVPLPLPTIITPPFLFVPYDFKQPRVMMDLTLSTDLTMLGEAIDALSAKIHRNVSAVFAERPASSTDLQWKTIISTNLPENQLLAFEIPEHPHTSVFAPVRFLVPNGTQKTSSTVELDGFYLVELPSEDADIDVVQAACEKRFADLFSPSNGQIVDKKLQRIRDKLCDPRSPFEPGQGMRCTIVPRSKRHSSNFVRDEGVLRVSNTRIDILLNPVFLDESQFCWSCLRDIDNSLQRTPKVKRITHTTLYECLTNFAQEEVLDEYNMAFCRNCRDFFRATKKMDLWSVPEVLVLHLKRFFTKGHYQRKLTIRVDYPEELDLSGRVLGDQKDEELKYVLVSVVEHDGGLAGGHCVADVLYENKWYKCNDEVVRRMRAQDVHSESGYILFYVRKR